MICLQRSWGFSTRMHEYSTRICKEHKLPVKTVVVFLQETEAIRKLQPVDRWELAGELISQFHYAKIILPQHEWKEIVDKEIPSLLPLIPLTKIKAGEEQEALSQATKCIEKIQEPELRKDLAAIFYLIGGFVYSTEIKRVIGETLMLDLMQSETYRDAVLSGEIKGKLEVAAKMLKKGMEITLISEITGLSEEEIVAIKQELTKK